MKTRPLLAAILLVLPTMLMSQVATIDECQKAARANYPLIKKYGLIERTTALTVSNINKQWLPQVGASVQATFQSDVMTLPQALKDMLSQRDYSVKGLKKDQYRVGINVEQNLWDGGRINRDKNIARTQGEVEKAQNDVSLYAVAQRVNELFFAVLITDERLKINNDLQMLLQSNLDKINAMYRGGTATRSDVSVLMAEKLTAQQQATELKAVRQSLLRVLSVFCGIDTITNVAKPPAIAVMKNECNRPELRLIDARLRLADVQEQSLRSDLMPRISAFVQGYYGYPGYDMFHDMFHHNWTLNGMVGLKITWNIGSLYTNKNNHAKIQMLRHMAENDRETFLFNNRLDRISQSEAILKYKDLMADDGKIVELRRQVRLVAESKLRHGIIDADNLLQEINRENLAKNNMSLHEVEMLKEIYNLKYTTNN